MTEPAFAYAPPSDLVPSSVVQAIERLPLAKQAELLWRLLSAVERDDTREVDALRRMLRALASDLPRCDEATARTIPVEEFRTAFGA